MTKRFAIGVALWASLLLPKVASVCPAQWVTTSGIVDRVHPKSAQSTYPLPSLSTPSLQAARLFSALAAQCSRTSGSVDREHPKSAQSM